MGRIHGCYRCTTHTINTRTTRDSSLNIRRVGSKERREPKPFFRKAISNEEKRVIIPLGEDEALEKRLRASFFSNVCANNVLHRNGLGSSNISPGRRVQQRQDPCSFSERFSPLAGFLQTRCYYLYGRYHRSTRNPLHHVHSMG